MTDQEILHWFHHSKGIEKEILADYLLDHNRTQESNVVRTLGQYEQKKDFNFKSQFITNYNNQEKITQTHNVTHACFNHNHNFILKYNGDLVFNNSQYTFKQNIKQVNATSFHLFTIDYNGKINVYCDHDLDAFYQEINKLENIQSALFAYDILLAINNNQEIIQMTPFYDQEQNKPDINNAVHVDEAMCNLLALDSNGKVHSWRDHDPRLDKLNNVAQISASQYIAALHYDGTLSCFAQHSSYLNKLENIIEIQSCGFTTYALKLDGSILKFNANPKYAKPIDFNNVFKINTTFSHAAFLELIND